MESQLSMFCGSISSVCDGRMMTVSSIFIKIGIRMAQRFCSVQKRGSGVMLSS
jgi:hypothetical protein